MEYVQTEQCEAMVNLVPKLDKGTTRKINYRLLFLINRYVKVVHNILGTQFNSTLKGLYTTTKWDLFLECKHGSIDKNHLMLCTIVTEWREYTHMIISVDAEKSLFFD